MPLGPTFSKTFATFASSGHLQNEPKRLGLWNFSKGNGGVESDNSVPHRFDVSRFRWE
jgi:hypothetical protein